MPTNPKTPKAVKGWAIVSGANLIVTVSMVSEAVAWHEAGERYGYNPFDRSMEDIRVFLEDNGYRCIRVLITPIQ